jgi:hypothetical protein
VTLSVIVTSCDTPDLLERCLAALDPQDAAREIVVADCSASDPTDAIRRRFPRVRVLRFDRLSVPGLRWQAVGRTSGDLIAAVEARCTPSGDWCRQLVDAHGARPDAPAIGGPVGLRRDATSFDWALYLTEYSAFAPPVGQGPSAQLSSANLSYKRAALEEAHDLLESGVWESAVHERWRREGRQLWLSPALVSFQGGMAPAAALRMRFHDGRAYAAERFAGASSHRVIYAIGAPLLPIVTTMRVARAAVEKGLARRFWRALVWIAALNLAWSAGELAGYIAGRPRTPHIV